MTYLLLDDDDMHRYISVDLPKHWIPFIAPRAPIAHRLQQIFEQFPNESYYGLLGDDLVPRTEGWDVKLIEVAGSDGVAFAKDSIYNGSFASHPVIGGDLVREIGWLSLPGLDHLYVDAVWTEIGRRRGVLRYVGDVTVEHMHFSNSKAAYDQTYRDHARYADSDKRKFEIWKKSCAL